MEPKKILLVEDEQLIRDLYTRELNKSGFPTISVETAEAGLVELGKGQFDMLLLDIMLPGMNGLQMLREFRSKNPQSQMLVILLTNLGQESVIKEGFELGAQAYLIKGAYTPDQIVQEIRGVFGGKTTGSTPPPAGTPPTTGTPPGTPPPSAPPAPGMPPTGTPPGAPPTGTPPGMPPTQPPPGMPPTV